MLRRISEVGHVDARQSPVIDAILEEVEQRHRRGGEPMDEESLEFAFEEMEHHEREGQELGGGGGCRRDISGLAADVGVRSKEKVDDGMDDQGTEIFHREYGAPSDLWAQVFHVDNALVS